MVKYDRGGELGRDGVLVGGGNLEEDWEAPRICLDGDFKGVERLVERIADEGRDGVEIFCLIGVEIGVFVVGESGTGDAGAFVGAVIESVFIAGTVAEFMEAP